MSFDPAIVAALIGATATLLVGVVTLVRAKPSDTSVQQTAHGNNAPVTQQVLQQVRHYTVESHTHQAQTRTPPDASDDPVGEILGAIIVALACILVAIVWWKYLFIAVTVCVIAVLVLVMSGWKRWVAFNRGATMLGVLTLVASGATIWALLVIPTAVGPVPSMDDVSAQWPHNRIQGSLTLLGGAGLIVYAMRLLGLAALLLALFGLMRTALSLTLLLREERRDIPRSEVIATHAARIGALDNRFSYLAGTLLLLVLGVALASPSVNALALRFLPV